MSQGCPRGVPKGRLRASDVLAKTGDGPYPTPEQATLRQFVTLGGHRTCSSRSVGWALKAIVGKPVLRDKGLVLTLKSDVRNKQSNYLVRATGRLP